MADSDVVVETPAVEVPTVDPYAELEDVQQREFVKLCDEQMGLDPKTAKMPVAKRLNVYIAASAPRVPAKREEDDEVAQPKLKTKVKVVESDEDDDRPMTKKEMREWQERVERERKEERAEEDRKARVANFNADLKDALKELDVKGDKARKFIEKTAKAEYLETNGTVPIGRLIKNATDEWKAVLKEENETYVKSKIDSRATRGEGSARTPAGEEIKFGKTPLESGEFQKMFNKRLAELNQ